MAFSLLISLRPSLRLSNIALSILAASRFKSRSMGPVKEIKPYIDTETRQYDTFWLLSVTKGVVVPFLLGRDDEIAFYSRHLIDFKADQRPLYVQLSPQRTATQPTLVDPVQPRPGFFVTYWNHILRNVSWRFEIHLWEVEYSGAPLVRFKIFRFFPYSKLTQYRMSE